MFYDMFYVMFKTVIGVFYDHLKIELMTDFLI